MENSNILRLSENRESVTKETIRRVANNTGMLKQETVSPGIKKVHEMENRSKI